MVELHPSSYPGPCTKCRHSNQETDDFCSGLVACKFGYGMRYGENCNQQLLDSSGNPVSLWLFEEYDGTNCTWFSKEEMQIVVQPGCTR
jgi:hypothetical protein